MYENYCPHCKYCDCRISNGISNRGELIADSGYEECYLKLDDYDNEYRIEVLGDGRSQSYPVTFCPFCGINLKEQSNEL